MKWFKHDSNASRDTKLKKLMMRYGLEGYGLYFYCLELITNNIDATNLTFALEDDATIIAHDLRLHEDDVNAMMKYMVELGLFENNDGVITCYKLAKRLDQSMTNSKNVRGFIQQLTDEKSANVMTMSSARHDTVKISHERKEENRKEYICANAQSEKLFDSFWQEYPKKKDKAKAKKAFIKLNPDEELLSKVISSLTIQKQTEEWQKENGRYIPYPTTWINGQRWEDEITAEQETEEFYYD